VRLDVVVRPTGAALSALADHPRPGIEGVVWSAPERWMAKLRPLGHVDRRLFDPLAEVLAAELDGAPATVCTLGPETVRPSGWLYVPVAGLDDLSAAVFDATEELVPVTHPQPFVGAIHLASGRKVPKELGGVPLGGSWTARSVELVADRSAPGRPRFEVLATFPLGG
jgi:2'-5' RNA ligase